MWIIFSLKILKESTCYQDIWTRWSWRSFLTLIILLFYNSISHFGQPTFFREPFFFVLFCFPPWLVQSNTWAWFLKHSNALFCRGNPSSTNSNGTVIERNSLCQPGNSQSKGVLQEKTTNRVRVCGQCPSVTAELTLTGLMYLHTATSLIIK